MCAKSAQKKGHTVASRMPRHRTQRASTPDSETENETDRALETQVRRAVKDCIRDASAPRRRALETGSPSPGDDDMESETSSDDSDVHDGQAVHIHVVFAPDAALMEDEDDSDWTSSAETWVEDDEAANDEDETLGDVVEALVSGLVAGACPQPKRDADSRRPRTRSKNNASRKSVSPPSPVPSPAPADSTVAAAALRDAARYLALHGQEQFDAELTRAVNSEREAVEAAKERARAKETREERKLNTKTFKKKLCGKRLVSDASYFGKLQPAQQLALIQSLEEVHEAGSVSVPHRVALLQLDIPANLRSYAMRKLDTLQHLDPSSSEYYKVRQWVDGFMRIPFGRKTEMPVELGKSSPEEISTFMSNARDQLDNVVYGMNDAKAQLIQILGKWVANPVAEGTAIAIKGPMGTGKTTLVKDGVSKVLGRPFALVALGGATDSSILEGHSYTYEGSMWGQIAQIVMHAGTMNPVIYFDELDKVSDTARGQEIIGVLTHLTDTSQNTQFHDKYFAGLDLDLSGALFIFSYNDENRVNPILRDRMHKIETKGYTAADKQVIAKQFLAPAIAKTAGFGADDVAFPDDVVSHIVEVYTQGEKGVRNLKRCLETIHAKLNVSRLVGEEGGAKVLGEKSLPAFQAPFTVTKEVADTLLERPKQGILETMYT
jgi:hypothetical protein